MGNCMLMKGFGVVEVQEMVKVMTSNGGIMELYAPITAERITSEFPGHAIFRGPENLPLLHSDNLSPGRLYYLLPITRKDRPELINTPYRMSFDKHRLWKRPPEELPRHNVWKVNLVICPDQLSEILSQEARTEELIHSVRTVAKCATTTPRLFPDQWSVSNSWKPDSDNLSRGKRLLSSAVLDRTVLSPHSLNYLDRRIKTQNYIKKRFLHLIPVISIGTKMKSLTVANNLS